MKKLYLGITSLVLIALVLATYKVTTYSAIATSVLNIKPQFTFYRMMGMIAPSPIGLGTLTLDGDATTGTANSGVSVPFGGAAMPSDINKGGSFLFVGPNAANTTGVGAVAQTNNFVGHLVQFKGEAGAGIRVKCTSGAYVDGNNTGCTYTLTASNSSGSFTVTNKMRFMQGAQCFPNATFPSAVGGYANLTALTAASTCGTQISADPSGESYVGSAFVLIYSDILPSKVPATITGNMTGSYTVEAAYI